MGHDPRRAGPAPASKPSHVTFPGETMHRLRDPRVVEPETPVTILLANGREIHAQRFHLAHSSDSDEPTIVVDADEYVYVIAPDEITAIIVTQDLFGEVAG
jgi:hypothetical protein